MFNTSPEKFVALFNEKCPGAYRQITAQDVRVLTECGLIGKYRYYSRADLELVRAILQYKQMRDKRPKKPPEEEQLEPPSCKLCGNSLPPQPEGKTGRPREYCRECELARLRDRHKRWRARRHKQKQLTEISVG